MTNQEITSAVNSHLSKCEQCQWANNNLVFDCGITQDGIPVVQVFGHCATYVNLMRSYE
jgi:hypothetical protein